MCCVLAPYLQGNDNVALLQKISYENLQAQFVPSARAIARSADQYPIISIEDGMAENDWEGWRLLPDCKI